MGYVIKGSSVTDLVGEKNNKMSSIINNLSVRGSLTTTLPCLFVGEHHEVALCIAIRTMETTSLILRDLVLMTWDIRPGMFTTLHAVEGYVVVEQLRR